MRTAYRTLSALGFGLLSACSQGVDGEYDAQRSAVEGREPVPGAAPDAERPDAERPPAERAEPTEEEGRATGEPFVPDTAPQGLALLAQALGQPNHQFVAPQNAGGKGSPGFAIPSGKLQEVDVVHVGGRDSNKPPLLVTVAGTGAVGILSSFRATNVAALPVHLDDSPRLLGYDHQLQVLTPPSHAKDDYQLLLSGRLLNGALWLTTWRVQPNGQLEQLHTLGFGGNAGVEVEHYALGHRALPLNGQARFQVVTPVLHDGGQQRLVSWEVNGVTGQITGKLQSASIAARAVAGSDLGLSLNAGSAKVPPHFVVTMRTANQGRLNHTIWNVNDNGTLGMRASSTGRDIRNQNNIGLSVANAVAVPVNDTGHVTAAVSGGQLRLDVWEDSACLDGTCQWGALNISDSTRDVAPNVPGVQLAPGAAPQPASQKVFLRDPLAGNDVFLKNPDMVQAIASVRKVMVVLVTLDAVRSGQLGLDDLVTVSQAAANVNASNASKMGLVAGEKMSLRNLLYGIMMASAGDATWAVSEYVAGDLDGMLTLMNSKAGALGMTNTFHCQRGNAFSSVSYSTARDQVTLWETAYQDELFLEFAGRGQQDVCGVSNGQPICHPSGQPNLSPMLNSAMSNYPNIDGYKTGAGGNKCQDLQQYANTPTCASNGCLAVQSSRIGRPLILLELDPDTNAGGNDWSDMAPLSDFGFRRIFTPERRGDSAWQAGNASDFAIDTVDDIHSVSVTLTGGSSFQLCNWATDLQAGDVDKSQCAVFKTAGLAGSNRPATPRQLDMVRLSTLYSDGDYLVGRLDGAALQLSLWRVGQRN